MSGKLLVLWDWLEDSWHCLREGITRKELLARRARIARLLQEGIHEIMQREFDNYPTQLVKTGLDYSVFPTLSESLGQQKE